MHSSNMRTDCGSSHLAGLGWLCGWVSGLGGVWSDEGAQEEAQEGDPFVNRQAPVKTLLSSILPMRSVKIVNNEIE